jgi:hypothetical protein
MALGYIKEATYQFSDLYLHGKWTLEVPERSFGGF